jgi:hypothetical protein
MRFDDGREVVAVLLCATKDIDGSKHLIYDHVEPGSGAKTSTSRTGCVYADLNNLVSIELAEANERAQTLHGWTTLTCGIALSASPVIT